MLKHKSERRLSRNKNILEILHVIWNQTVMILNNNYK